MAFTNFDTKEIHCKVIYFGPPSSGKTENLRSILKHTSQDLKSGLIQLSEKSPGSSQFFDFLPISIGQIRDFHVRLHLFTLPSNPLYDSVQSVILRGLDGFIYVADSRVEAMVDNISHLQEVRRLLSKEGYNVADMPRVIQYNKQDLPDIVPLDILRGELNPGNHPEEKACALKSQGTLETLQNMTKQVLKSLGH